MINIGIVGHNSLVGQVFMPQYRTSELIQHQTHFLTRRQDQFDDCYDIDRLHHMAIIVSMATSQYTHQVLPLLRQQGWNGYWLDASSALRYQEDTCLALPPVNESHIKKHLAQEGKNFSGPNCTTSLLCIALHGLLKHKLIDQLAISTYQSLSGAGKQALNSYQAALANNTQVAAEPLTFMAENRDNDVLQQLTPWIDKAMPNGQTKEEFKMSQEIKKITGQNIDLHAVCVRVPILRTHAQTVFVTLNQPTSLDQFISYLPHKWHKLIENNEEETKTMLSPQAVFDQHVIHTGRIRQLSTTQFSLYTIGDQLQWGAAKPLIDTLKLLCQHCILQSKVMT